MTLWAHSASLSDRKIQVARGIEISLSALIACIFLISTSFNSWIHRSRPAAAGGVGIGAGQDVTRNNMNLRMCNWVPNAQYPGFTTTALAPQHAHRITDNPRKDLPHDRLEA